MNEDVTELKLNEVRNLSDHLSRWHRFLCLEAVNVTPWAGGGPRNKTIVLTRDGIIFSLPSSESLKGVMRWIARAAINSILKYSSISKIDEVLSYIYGGKRGDEVESSRISIHLNCKLENEYRLKNDILQILNFIKELYNLVKDYRLLSSVIQCLSFYCFNAHRNTSFNRFIDDYCALRRRLPSSIISKLHDIALRLRAVSLFKAYSIPRIIIKLIGAERLEDFIEVLPIPPGYVKINVCLYLDKYFINRVKSSYAKVIMKFSSYLLIYSLTIHGIGSMVTRGFGRFNIKPEKLQCSSMSEDICEDIIKILQYYNSNTKDAIIRLHNELIGLAKIIIEKVTKNINEISTSSRLPSLSNAYVEIVDSPKHFFPGLIQALPRREKASFNRSIFDVWEALSAIGYSTLKVVWKLLAHLNVRNSGIGLHTWILGLPRWQKDTGYALIEHELVNDCVENVKASPGRRRSSIMLYPLMLDNKVKVIILDYKTIEDHIDKITRNEVTLYHVGRHGRPNNPWRHLVKLEYAFSQASIPSPVIGACGPDQPAGILRPSSNKPLIWDVSKKDLAQVINDIHEIALDFIKHALR